MSWEYWTPEPEPKAKADITIPVASFDAAWSALSSSNATISEVAAACLAMLQAWPGMTHMEPNLANGIIILPLTEKTDDKA